MVESEPIAHQATCVSVDGLGLLIKGASGSGKSSLALALIDRGAMLVGDDGVLVDASQGRLIARPHPRTRGLLEVRNLGLLRFPVCHAAPVGIVLILDPEAPRYVESAEEHTLLGIAVPLLRLTPREPMLAIKAELALARFGNSPA